FRRPRHATAGRCQDRGDCGAHLHSRSPRDGSGKSGRVARSRRRCMMNRREILSLPLAAAAFSARAQSSASFTKSICSVIFPLEMPRAECFTQAKSAGFDAMELAIGPDLRLDISHDDARRLADAAQKAGIRIATLWVSEPLHQNPLNAPDPSVRARG